VCLVYHLSLGATDILSTIVIELAENSLHALSQSEDTKARRIAQGGAIPPPPSNAAPGMIILSKLH
jgi:hypothetical protein